SRVRGDAGLRRASGDRARSGALRIADDRDERASGDGRSRRGASRGRAARTGGDVVGVTAAAGYARQRPAVASTRLQSRSLPRSLAGADLVLQALASEQGGP